jgi:acyl-CoA thioesterase-2
VTAVQSSGKPIMVAQISCHAPEDGELVHQMPVPKVGRPEDAVATELDMLPLDTRVVDGIDLADPAVRPPRFNLWLRVPRPLGDDQEHHQGFVAFASDLTLIGTTLLPIEGYSQADSPGRLHTAPVTHSIWFHAPVRVDDWVLFAQESPVLSGARGFGTGHAFDASGTLVASFAQESMIRTGGR